MREEKILMNSKIKMFTFEEKPLPLIIARIDQNPILVR